MSDEIVHEMDLVPTLAGFAGGKVPSDRDLDGMDKSEFLLGQTEKSGWGGFVVYPGADILGMKWLHCLNLEEREASLKKFPLVPTGAPDPYEPPIMS